jgi:hypothetical protein
MTDLATTETVLTITSKIGETWTIEGKKFVVRKPKGFRGGFEGELACPHRNRSTCDECANTYANIVEVCGEHFWVRDYAEWRDLVGQLCAIQAQYEDAGATDQGESA